MRDCLLKQFELLAVFQSTKEITLGERKKSRNLFKTLRTMLKKMEPKNITSVR